MRDPKGPVSAFIAKVGQSRCSPASFVLAEHRFGVERVGSRRLAARLELVLSKLNVLPLIQPADIQYSTLRVALERAGRPISQNDMLIAAHALTLEATVVTDNEKEFARIAGLKVEN
jgi:tRNA(fMet)-specific endonuclease VapC